jgi:undecaprenyl-diphosphatase
MARIHRQDLRDLLVRAVAPGIVLFGVLVGIGLLLSGPLSTVDAAEDRLTDAFNRNRTGLWDPISWVCSRFGNTEIVIGVCLLAVAIIWWRTRDWRWSVVPLIAISLQATIFLFATMAVGRQRPPALPMDASPPTSSYPSGHTGAATALYLSLLLMAEADVAVAQRARGGDRHAVVGGHGHGAHARLPAATSSSTQRPNASRSREIASHAR